MDCPEGGNSRPFNWAQVVKNANPSKCGFDLHYIPPSPNSPITITQDDVREGRNKWKNGLVGVVLGSNPSYFVMKKFVETKWKDFGNIAITKLKSGTFTFLFDSEDAKLKAMEQGPWMFYSKIMILKPWTPLLDASMDLVTTLPIWIRLMNPKFDYFTPSVLSKLASHIGIPLVVDHATAQQSRLDFARVCVEVNATCSFPSFIPFVNAQGLEESIEVVYEWRPPSCSHCHTFGHTNSRCPSMVQPTKTWKSKQQPLPLNHSHPDPKHSKPTESQQPLSPPSPNQPPLINIPTNKLSTPSNKPSLPASPSHPSTSFSNSFDALLHLEEAELEMQLGLNKVPTTLEPKGINSSDVCSSPTTIDKAESSIVMEEKSLEDMFPPLMAVAKPKDKKEVPKLKEIHKASIQPRRGKMGKSPPPKLLSK